MNPDRLHNGYAAALSFLRRKRSADGLWRDFRTLAGASSEWVTGFVLHALPQADADGIDILSARQRPNGGWGYAAAVPPDADSTAWALLAMRAGCGSPAVPAGLRFLREHQALTGGICTYVFSDGIDKFVDAPSPHHIAGWLAPRPCVTATAIRALRQHGCPSSDPTIQAAVGALLRARDTDGLWRSHWWSCYTYPTCQAVQALLSIDTDSVPARDAADTVAGLQQPDGSWNGQVFSTAMGLQALAMAGVGAIAQDLAAEWLLATQQPDGSWPSIPILRIPPPNVMAATEVIDWRVGALGTGVLLADPERIFTSAAGLSALASYQEAGSTRFT